MITDYLSSLWSKPKHEQFITERVKCLQRLIEIQNNLDSSYEKSLRRDGREDYSNYIDFSWQYKGEYERCKEIIRSKA